jgi:transposase InsO family protein
LAIPIEHQDAVTIAKAFVEVSLKFGIPQMILTDQGSNFMSGVFTVCKLLKIKKIKCTAYHPETNGALERKHGVLVEYLRCFILDHSNWYKWLPYATFVFKTTPPYSHGIYPS